MTDAIANKVAAILIRQLGVDPDDVTAEASLRDDLHCDSLDRIQLTLELEEAFDLYIPDKEAEPILRVGDIVAYLEMRLAAAKRTA